MDNIDLLCPTRNNTASDLQKRVVSCLLPLLEGDQTSPRVVIIATSSRPNDIDPALRRPGRLDKEIELSAPNAEERSAILSVLLSSLQVHVVDADDRSLDVTQRTLAEVAKSAHGMVASDLLSVCKEACHLRLLRRGEGSPLDALASSLADLGLQGQTLLLPADLTRALNKVTPSALKEIAIEIPSVRWTDIGGMEHVKQALREVAEWPLQYPKLFASLGIAPPKGVLLYGPPGCSKTLMVTAPPAYPFNKPRDRVGEGSRHRELHELSSRYLN